MRKNLSQDQIKKIRAMIDAGKTTREVSLEIGIKQDTIRSVARRVDIKPMRHDYLHDKDVDYKPRFTPHWDFSWQNIA